MRGGTKLAKARRMSDRVAPGAITSAAIVTFFGFTALTLLVFLTRKDVPWDSHTVEARLAHDRSRKDRMVVERGRSTPHRGRWYEARTAFERAGTADALVAWAATMSTGVTHQIRVHAAFAGLALAGDRLYGGGASDPDWDVPFLLHHRGLEGPDVEGALMSPVPQFWPTLRGLGDAPR